MSALLEFMYKGEVHVSQEALNSFLKSAENLQVCSLFLLLYTTKNATYGISIDVFSGNTRFTHWKDAMKINKILG